jgi:DNA-binding transcriptional LysR family regulator
VSQRVSRLETSLGSRLLERTTRLVRPTLAGATYYARCAALLADLEEANLEVKSLARSPRGLLRVHAPILFGQAALPPIVTAFLARYPEVEIEVVASDRKVNLIEEQFDLAVLAGHGEEDSSLVTRVLYGGEYWCCAAPSYVETHGLPAAPEELATRECILIGEPAQWRWTFERGAERRVVEANGRLRVNTVITGYAAARAGAGIAMVPRFLCGDDVSSGAMSRLLGEWAIERKPLRVAYPSGRHLPLRVRLFVDALVGFMRNHAVSSLDEIGTDPRALVVLPPAHSSTPRRKLLEARNR